MIKFFFCWQEYQPKLDGCCNRHDDEQGYQQPDKQLLFKTGCHFLTPPLNSRIPESSEWKCQSWQVLCADERHKPQLRYLMGSRPNQQLLLKSAPCSLPCPYC